MFDSVVFSNHKVQQDIEPCGVKTFPRVFQMGVII